jgi:hypothetical protein
VQAEAGIWERTYANNAVTVTKIVEISILGTAEGLFISNSFA